MKPLIYKISVLMLLVFTVGSWFGCGGSDGANVIAETPSETLPTIDPTTEIRGLLSDRATKEALIDATVQLVDAQGNIREVMTTDKGVFVFENLLVDQSFTLKIERDGYEPQEMPVKTMQTDETTKVIIELAPMQEAEELAPGEGLSLNARAPSFSLSDGNGKMYALADYAGEKKVVMIFYRGNW